MASRTIGLPTVRIGHDHIAPVLPVRASRTGAGCRLKAILVPSLENTGKPSMRGSKVSSGAVRPVRVGDPDVAVRDERDHTGCREPERRRQASLRSDDEERDRNGEQETEEEQDRRETRDRLKPGMKLRREATARGGASLATAGSGSSARAPRRAPGPLRARGRGRRATRSSAGRGPGAAFVARHAVRPSPTGSVRASASRAARICCMARWSRDRTVPAGQPRTSAASSGRRPT